LKPFQIDWKHLYKKGQQIRKERQPKIEEVADEEETKNRTTSPLGEDKMGVYIELLEMDVWIHKTNIATELTIEENSKKVKKTDKELVPEEYHEYLDIFSKEKAHRFPESRPWDYKIEMKEGFEPKLFKNYNLTWWNKMNWTNSSNKTSKKDTSDYLSHLWHHPFSLFQKRMENFDLVRTTGI
jgi:hypothetical protein